MESQSALKNTHLNTPSDLSFLFPPVSVGRVQLQELKIHGLLKEREVLVSELKVTKCLSQSLRRQVRIP